MAIFLGIDGGGSKTSCALGDETSILGTGTAGGSNLVRVGEAQAREALASAIRQACTVAGISPSQVRRACVGLAGAAQPEITEAAHRILSDLVSGEIEVVGDMVIALEAAFGGGPGVIMIAGTGSIAYGRNPAGETARAGGWGFAVSDEGSGHWIGRSAVAAALRIQDQSPAGNRLLEGILKAWQLATQERLVLVANAMPPPDFAALFPAVLELAEAGDPRAADVLTRAGRELANLAAIVVQRLFPLSGVVPVAMSGGVFRRSALVRQVFYNTLIAEHPGAAVHASVIEPVRGALELARKAAGKK